jgi:hypothetical protein
MDSKLTLSLNKAVIEKAKEYAKSQKISLSRLIEAYLDSLTTKKAKEIEITPLVKNLNEKFDFKKLINGNTNN